VPFSGIVWWEETLKEWSNWAADAGMVDTAVGDGVDMDMSEEETVELVG
jgi:hypothetical protein